MTPEPNRPDEREAADVLARLYISAGLFNMLKEPDYTATRSALDRAIAILRRAAPREGASVEADINEMALWALGTRVPEHVRKRYGYAEHYSVGDYMAGDTNENLDVMRAALATAVCHQQPAGAVAASPLLNDPALDRQLRNTIARAEVVLGAIKSDRAPREGGEAHFDDIAVDAFAAMMKAKLAKKRAEGYGGWDDPEVCSVEFLQEGLARHMAKGDPVDVANFCMMLRHYDAPTRPQPAGETVEADLVCDDCGTVIGCPKCDAASPPSDAPAAGIEQAFFSDEMDVAAMASDAPERDAVGALVPEATEAGDGIVPAIIGKGDWCIVGPYSVRVVDERFARGWNECRKAFAAALESRPVVDEAVVSHHWIGEEMMRERTRVETNTGRIVARIRCDTLSSEWAWGQEWYVNEAAARAAVEWKFPSALSRTQPKENGRG